MLTTTARTLAASSLVLTVASVAGHAQSVAALSAGRFEAASAAQTIGRGRVQVEVDMFSRSTGSDGDVDQYVWSVGSTTARVGLSRKTELQVSYEPYTEVRRIHQILCEDDRVRRAGDVTVGGKFAVWGGNGRSAFAVMPFVSVPTASTGGMSGGVALPLETSLGYGFTASLTTIIESAPSASEGSRVKVSQSASVGRQLMGRVAGYASVLGSQAAQLGGVATMASGGVTIGVTQNLQVNGGASVALSGVSDQSSAYLGFVIRR
jgi:hypothetical protein